MKYNVCGGKFEAKQENRYVAAKEGVLFAPSTQFDCFDCPFCGCQVVAQERISSAREIHKVKVSVLEETREVSLEIDGVNVAIDELDYVPFYDDGEPVEEG